MARRTKIVVITDPSAGTEKNRDAGKAFLITEMGAARAEKWACRALFIAAQSGADVGNVRAGLAGVAVMGIQTVLGNAKFAEVEPLLDEMFECVRILPDPNNIATVRPLVPESVEPQDIEEVSTRITLRSEVLTLHLGFSFADFLSTIKSDEAKSAPPQPGSPATGTSQPS